MPAALRVMTYNVHGCVGTDRRYDPRRVLDVIREINPAVFGLQEVRTRTGRTPEIIELITKEMPDHHVLFLKTLTDAAGDYGNVLISRYPVTAHIDVDLEGRGPRRAISRRRPVEARRAIFGRLDIQGAPLWVIVTHLGVETRARRDQALMLVEAIDRHTRLEREPAICMGDFNEWVWRNPFLRYLDRSFSRHTARRTFPAPIPLLPLDRIWMTSHVKRTATWAHRSPRARRASDHLPLCVECSLITAG
jgi:endonuclease/exonuclease/phosphatase family metal-dependent hydrolase